MVRGQVGEGSIALPAHLLYTVELLEQANIQNLTQNLWSRYESIEYSVKDFS